MRTNNADSLPTCYAYPHCDLVADQGKCLCVEASGLRCDVCPHHASSVPLDFGERIEERVRRHHSFVSSNRWRKEVRPKVLENSNYACAICGETYHQLATNRREGLVVHHIIHKSADEDLSPCNLVVLCNKCHDRLHGFIPYGMWLYGWPDVNMTKSNIKEFYETVREVSMKNREQFKAPMEHVMGASLLCLICTELSKCEIGRNTLYTVYSDMIGWSTVDSNIADLKDGMTHKVVEGYVTEIGEEKEVETRYGKRRLAYATLEDDTGKIRLTLWENEIKQAKKGDLLRICNGHVTTYENVLTLSTPKNRSRIIVNPSSYVLLNPDLEIDRLVDCWHNHSPKAQHEVSYDLRKRERSIYTESLDLQVGRKGTKYKNKETEIKDTQMEKYPYHKIIVDKLEGSSFKGKFSEILIRELFKNQHFSCTPRCYMYNEPEKCNYKQKLMYNPIKQELVCTTVLVDVKSQLPPDNGFLTIRSKCIQLLDSQARSYQCYKPQLCGYADILTREFRHKYGYVPQEEYPYIYVHESTKVTCLLPFPEMPQEEKITGFIIELWCSSGGVMSSIETFDFRLANR